MKPLIVARRWLALSLVGLAATALAQKEQWLEYHTSRNGRGYRWLDLTKQAPTNLVLPKLNGEPYFARWATPMDPAGGRWLCFDRKTKSGPCDRMFIDTKGDGHLDTATPISPFQLDQNSAYFQPAKIVFKGEDGPITYHLVVRFMSYDAGDVRALAESGCYYGGDVDLGGKKRHLEVVDGNVNGTFNDQGTDPNDCDRIAVASDKISERYLGKMIEVDGQVFKVEVARDGAFIKLQKAQDLEFGQVRVPEAITELVAFGENGHFVRKPVKGQFSLPAGKYHVHQWTIDRKDKKGDAWQLQGYGLDESASFEVAAGKPAAVSIAEPVRVVLSASETTNQVGFNLNFTSTHGESIQVMKGNSRPPGPKLSLVSRDGSYRSTNTFEFG